MDTTHSERHVEAAPGVSVAGPDSAIIHGDAVNPYDYPIWRSAPGGVLRKDHGSRTWRFVRGTAWEERQAQRARKKEEFYRVHGGESLTVVIAVRDTIDTRILRSQGIAVSAAPPCTLAVRTTLRARKVLGQQWIPNWDPGAPRSGPRQSGVVQQPLHPGPNDLKRKTGPRRGPPIRLEPRPAPTAPDTVRGGEGAAPTVPLPVPRAASDVVFFSDGFEGSFPGSFWTSEDYDPDHGSDTWDRTTSFCGYVYSGSYSVGCAAYSDASCYTYDFGQDAELFDTYWLDMSAYSSFQLYVRAWYSMGGGDNFTVWTESPSVSSGVTYTGSSGGWVYLSSGMIDNSSHAYDQYGFTFEFTSDQVGLGTGVYLDDVILYASPRPQPNLAATTPSGWSGPIVPSMQVGTTTTGATLTTGQTTYIDWALRNVGTGSAGGFWVDYYIDGSILGSDFVSSLAPNVIFTRTDLAYVVSTAGVHTLKMVIDPTGAVAETDESDNTYQASFTWSLPPAPDLVVQSVTVTAQNPPAAPPEAPPPRAPTAEGAASEAGSYIFTMGQTADIAVTVKNQGTASTGTGFALDWYQSRSNAPTAGTRGDQTASVGALAAGASQTVHFFATGTKAQTWNMYILADAAGAINEGTAEGNNAAGPVQVVWSPGTVTLTGSFAYLDSLAGGTLPMSCARFTLYDQDSTGDDSLAAGYLALNDGSFTIGPIPNVDGDGGFLDPFVRVWFEADAACISPADAGLTAVVMADTLGLEYYFDSPVLTDVPNGTVAVSQAVDGSRAGDGAMHIYRTILIKGYGWVQAHGGSIPSVRAVWGPGYRQPTGYSDKAKIIFIAGQDDSASYAPDEWDDGVILHEYGHHVAWVFQTMYQDSLPKGIHRADSSAATTKLAWSEGWAQYFGAHRTWGYASPVVRDYGRTASGNLIFLDTNLETGVVNAPDRNINNLNVTGKGPLWEMNVAGILWDIYDPVVDGRDSLSDATNLWNEIRYSPCACLRDVVAFQGEYESQFANPVTDLRKFGLVQRIFLEHGIAGSPVTTDVEQIAVGRGRPQLLANYPNPFNPITNFVFDLPDGFGRRPVRVSIYDAQGRLVRTLLHQPLGPGRYRIQWDGRGSLGGAAASGMYWCRLETGAGTSSRKILLLR